jgi:peptidoglycan/xylan/chitin deacetylase (PgdA/CDA1 family)
VCSSDLTNGKTTTVRLISHLLAQQGWCVGMTNTDGVYVDGHCIDTGDCSGPKSAKNVLHHPDVDAAVLETARGGILREGLAFDKCDVAVVTNVGSGDHLGLNYITTVDELAVLKRVIVQNVAAKGTAVLNATDPVVAAMAAKCKGAVTFFALDQYHPVMATHRAQGHAVVYVDKGQIVAAKGTQKHYLNLSEIPMTLDGAIGFQVENVMASVAAVWALGLDWETVRAGLASFSSENDNAQGRFNIFNYKGATVIADYGHNPDAMAALVQAVQAMPASRRSVVITFDDGYADNCLEALPILEAEGVPATFFVSTGTIGTDREFWWDELERLLRVGDGHPPRIDLPLGGAHFTAPTASVDERIAAYDALHPRVKALGPAEREAFLAALARWSGRGTAGRPTHRPMTVDELRRLAASPWVTIGAHTDTHTCLSRLSPREQLEDIAVSRRKLEAWIGRPVTVFSYPFGGSSDIDEASVQACMDIGFSRVAANWPGTVHRWTDSLQIPRCLVRDWPEAEFAKQIDGFWLE